MSMTGGNLPRNPKMGVRLATPSGMFVNSLSGSVFAGQVIRLTWLSFSLEDPTGDGRCFDYVSVFDNSSAAAVTNDGRIGNRE